MHKKWIIRSFAILLAVVGIHLLSPKEPNQELVVQLSAQEASSDQAQEAIVLVKKQLQDFGIEGIQVTRSSHNEITFVYYSDRHISAIKALLSKDKRILLGSKLPVEPTNQEDYPLQTQYNTIVAVDVYEIQQHNTTDAGFDGYVIEIASKVHRFFIPDSYLPTTTFKLHHANEIENVAYIALRKRLFTIGQGAYAIPEVRAGPRV